MRILKKRFQRAVCWKLTGVNPDGVPVFGTARELKVRWEHVNIAYTDADGQQLLSSSRVFLGEDIREGDLLWEGKLTDVPDPTNPLNNEKVFVVGSFSKIPNLRATDYLREALL